MVQFPWLEVLVSRQRVAPARRRPPRAPVQDVAYSPLSVIGEGGAIVDTRRAEYIGTSKVLLPVPEPYIQ